MVRGLVVLLAVVYGAPAWAAPAPAAIVRLTAHLVDADTGEPMIGATVVATGPSAGEEVGLVDESGAVTLGVSPDVTLLTIYYDDATISHAIALAPGGDAYDLGTLRLTIPAAEHVDLEFPIDGDLSVNTSEPFAASALHGAWPTTRTRDTAAFAALVPPLPSSVTILDHSRRLAGAPALALVLLEQATFYTQRGGRTLDDRQAGVALDSTSGSNELHGSARLAYGGEGGALEAAAGGPLVHDHAWWAAATALGSGDAQGLARVDYHPTLEEGGHITALHQDVQAPGATAALRDDWAAAEWVSKHDDNKLELTGDASGERVAGGATGDVTRAAARAEIVDRRKLLGYQTLQLAGEVGAGDAGAVGHRDAAAAGRDEWQLTPALTIDAGLRYDERWYGSAHATVWQPHATVAWDWTKEGRSELFATGARSSLLDEGALGAWVTGERHRDDAIAGARYEVVAGWIASLAARATDAGGARHAGAEVWLDHRRHELELRVIASSAERALAGWLRVDLHGFVAGASGRWAGAGDVVGSQAAASVGWRWRLRRRATIAPSAELLHDRLGTTLRAVIDVAF